MSAVEEEEESKGLHAICPGWQEVKPRALEQVREKELSLGRAEQMRAADKVRPRLEELEALQRNLVILNELMSRAQSWLKLKTLQSGNPFWRKSTPGNYFQACGDAKQ